MNVEVNGPLDRLRKQKAVVPALSFVALGITLLTFISNTKKITAVVLSGRLLDRDTLNKMLADVEDAANKK